MINYISFDGEQIESTQITSMLGVRSLLT